MGYAAAIEQQLTALEEHEHLWRSLTAREREDADINLHALRNGEPYFVGRAIGELLMASAATLPDASWAYEDLPGLSGWVYLEQSVPLPPPTPGRTVRTDLPATLQALTWSASRFYEGGTGVSLGFYGPPRMDRGFRGPDLFLSCGRPFGARLYEEDAPPVMRDIARRCEAFTYTLFRFVRQRLLTIATRPLTSRHTRRRIARHLTPVPDVRVIALRAREYQPRAESQPHEVGYSCQWLVRGHWHGYHTRQGLQPRWVAPYVKGPPEKPLRVAAQTAYAVVR